MPIQSKAHNTIGWPAPSRTIPRARSVRSHLFVTGSYAIMLPIGGVASMSKVASDKPTGAGLVSGAGAGPARAVQFSRTPDNRYNEDAGEHENERVR